MNTVSSNEYSVRAVHPARKWIADSGAAISVVNSLESLNHGDIRTSDARVTVANGQAVRAEKTGGATLCLRDGDGKKICFTLKRVLYSPHFSGNLLSIKDLVRENNLLVIFNKGGAYLETRDGRKVFLESDYSLSPHSPRRSRRSRR